MIHPSTSSDLKSSSVAICGYTARLKSLQVLTDGTNAATIIVYDNATTNSGVILAKYVLAGASNAALLDFSAGVIANNGLYVAISGTGAACIVYYDRC